MANVFGGPTLRYSGLIAGSGLTAATCQYRFVKISADNTVVLCAATTDVPCGVLQEPAVATGEPVDVVFLGETSLQADASITIGGTTGIIATSADGQAQAVVATQYVAGQAINIGGATTAGTLITAIINCTAPALKA